jgi:beta-lactamase class C
MKASASRRKTFLRTTLASVCLLCSIVPGTTAQTSTTWNPDATGTTDVTAATAAVSTPQDKPAPLPAQVRRRPLAAGFDVRLFEAMAQDLVANQRVPGLAMAIVHDGKVLSARGYGITDVRAAEPVDAHTVFRLASLSKSFAGTLTGMLVSEGALRWDSRVADYIPALQFSDPTAAQRLTVADVLSHRVGLKHHTFDRDIERNADYHTLVQKLANAPMECAPGECYGYQNLAFSLVGDVVFAASGQFYNEAVARRIFKPLGMEDASVGLEGIVASPRWAKPHVRAGAGWTPVMPKPTYYRVAPAAGVNASASDMAQWLLAQGGHRPDVLPAPLLATLQAPIVGTPGELRGASWRRDRLNAAGYGLGWRIYDYAGHRLVFHGGAVQGYRGVMAMLPERDLGIAILWNSDSSLPSGLLPTILDRAIGLPAQPWLDVDPALEASLYATRDDTDRPAAPPQGGSQASQSTAEPR